MSKLSAIISLATVAYLFMSKEESGNALDDLKKQVQDEIDRNNAMYDQLHEEIENSNFDYKGYINPGTITATCKVLVSSIYDKYWCMAGWVTLENKDNLDKTFSGIMLHWEYNGHQCTWNLWNKGVWRLPANGKLEIRLHSANTKVVIDNKSSRLAVRDALKQESTWVKSVGSSINITGRVLILQDISGQVQPIGVIIDKCKGTLTYDSYGCVFADESTKNGAALTEFTDYISQVQE